MFIFEEVKETTLNFSQGSARVLWFMHYKMSQYNSV